MPRSFDINSLLNFHPPQYFCERCYALLFSDDIEAMVSRRNGDICCPTCGVKYTPTEAYPYWRLHNYLAEANLQIAFGNLFKQAQELAKIAHSFNEYLTADDQDWGRPGTPPIQAFIRSMLQAKQFVHFTSYGMSQMFLGMLKMVAQTVDVRGIVSNVEGYMVDELLNRRSEAPLLDVKVFERKNQFDNWDAIPHQKIIVVDGLLAFKGSANLTVSGWRKTETGRDVIEAVTRVEEVAELNNRFFSPIWASFDSQNEIVMHEPIPF